MGWRAVLGSGGQQAPRRIVRAREGDLSPDTTMIAQRSSQAPMIGSRWRPEICMHQNRKTRLE